jgi:hypothetical protein
MGSVAQDLGLIPDRDSIKPEPEPTDEEIEEEVAEDNEKRDLWRYHSLSSRTGASVFRGSQTGTNTE